MRLPRQAPWGLADQAVSAATNVALTVVVARASTAHQLGEFSLAYVLFVLLLGLTRTTGVGVLAIEYGDDPALLRPAARGSTGYSVSVGALTGLAGVVVALVVGGGYAGPLLVVGLAAPFLLLQDAVRGVLFCQARPQAALVNDSIWAVVEVALFGWVLSSGSPSVSTLVLCWAAGGVLASLVGLAQIGVLPRPAWPHVWIERHAAVARPLVLSEVLTQVPAHVVYLTMPLVSTVAQLGLVRGAYVFFGPLAVLNAGASMLALPHAVRERRLGDVPRIGRTVSLALAASSVVWVAVVVLLPAQLGREVIGRSWNGGASTRLLLGVSLVAEAVLVGQVAALGALRRTDVLAKLRSVSAPVTVVASLVLGARFGAVGVASGFAIGYWTAAVLAWRGTRAAVTVDRPAVLAGAPT